MVLVAEPSATKSWENVATNDLPAGTGFEKAIRILSDAPPNPVVDTIAPVATEKASELTATENTEKSDGGVETIDEPEFTSDALIETYSWCPVSLIEEPKRSVVGCASAAAAHAAR